MKKNANRNVCTIAATFFFAMGVATYADNWPRFRGPNGVGIATNQNIPIQWEKENILWKVPLPGLGFSSPIIWEKKLYIQTASADGYERQLMCLDATTGKTIWKKKSPGAPAKDFNKNYNSYASSTPATDGKRIYISVWDGKDIFLIAYDMDGKEVWSRNLGSFKSQHGAGASPVVYGDKVYFLFDQDDKASLLALDSESGKIVWQQERPAYRACYGAPFMWKRNGNEELVIVTSLELTGYDPDNGEVHWRYPWKHSWKFPLRVTNSPVAWKDIIFATAGDGGGPRAMIAVRVNGDMKHPKTELCWSTTKRETAYVPSVLVYDGYVYQMYDKGWANCYDAETGKKIWYERMPDATFIASPVLIDGNIYAPSEQGDVFVFAASPKFQMLARNELGEMIRATPAVADQRLYIRGLNHLFCIGATPKR